MKVIVSGGTTLEGLVEKLEEVVQSTVVKMGLQSDLNITGYEVHEAEVTFKFKVEGMEETQLMTVEHHEGYPELFTWLVNVSDEVETSNEEESMYDEFTVNAAQGKEMEFQEIESLYNMEDMVAVESEEYSDMKKITYQHEEGFSVIQIMQGEKLIQEIKLTPKDGGIS